MREPVLEPEIASDEAPAVAPALADANPAPAFALAEAKAVAMGGLKFFRSIGPPFENVLELLYARKKNKLQLFFLRKPVFLHTYRMLMRKQMNYLQNENS